LAETYGGKKVLASKPRHEPSRIRKRTLQGSNSTCQNNGNAKTPKNEKCEIAVMGTSGCLKKNLEGSISILQGASICFSDFFYFFNFLFFLRDNITRPRGRHPLSASELATSTLHLKQLDIRNRNGWCPINFSFSQAQWLKDAPRPLDHFQPDLEI
jgi:hypothetical protein